VEPIPEHPCANILVEHPDQDMESVRVLRELSAVIGREIIEEFNKEFSVNFGGTEDCTDCLQKPLFEKRGKMS
jgi:hypothetical protein